MDWTTMLAESRERILKHCTETVLAQATAARMVAAWTLVPAPRDPARHVEAAHVRGRQHLARLLDHDPAAEVPSVMTEQMFNRLTDAAPAPLDARAGVTRYTYTPRKTLRRVLDHSLDHLNQIDQWIAWRIHGVVPAPTDGWVPSTVTLPDDRAPLAQPDLDAWLWRIDQTVRLLAQHAAALSADELDWQPPDGGWPLRRVLHHVAAPSCCTPRRSTTRCRVRTLAAVTLEEASRRLEAGVRAESARGEDASTVYAGLYGVLRTPAEVVADVLTMEGELLASI